MENIQLKYPVLKDDFVKAGEASSNLKKILRQLGIDAHVIRRASIATYEAEMNIVIHSEGGFINVLIDPKKIEITAIDQGPGIENVELAMKEGFSTASSAVREMGFGAGMGLPNIKRCSDEFDIYTEIGKYTKVVISIFNQ